MHDIPKHLARGIAPLAIAAAMLTSLAYPAQAGHDEDWGGDYWQGWGPYGWYAPQYEEHGWHAGPHHDWHSGPHFGPHSGPHWDPVYGWHAGPHYGPHDEDHHDWHAGPHHNWYED